jgi:type II secretory pathway pseudopilin PulG
VSHLTANVSDALRRIHHQETGIGLIEVVVAMFLLALLALSFVPVLIQGMRTTASNAVMATATQLVSSTIGDARASGPLCSGVAAFANDPNAASATTSAGHGVTLETSRSSVTCPTGASDYPTTVSFSVTVTSTADPSIILAKATTLIFVKAAS